MGFTDDLDQFRASVLHNTSDGKFRQSNCSLHFVDTDADFLETPSETYIPIVKSGNSPTFNFESFSSDLRTSRLGRVVIHVETTRTTNDFFDGPNFLHDGIVVVADKQTQGRGRAGNIWLSPLGNVRLGWDFLSSLFGFFSKC